MLYRKITEQITDWYNNSSKALLIDGARQTGKTTIIKDFLENNCKNYVELNLQENKDALMAFDTASNSKELLIRLTALSYQPVIENETIFFIDEIQEAQDAITPIKFLTQNKKYRFIFSGSLLGIKLKDIRSIGVGYIKTLHMYPMDFEEFCIANNISVSIIDYIKNCFEELKPVDQIIHKQLMQLFNTYLIIGGMPEVVKTFVESHNLTKINDIFYNIDTGYLQDITKYDKQEKLLIEDIYNLIPSELNSQNKRMILKNINEKARFYQYEESFAWLANSGVGLFVYNVDNPIYPLLASKERTLFKLFLCDTGLLSYKLLDGNQIKVLNGEVNINFGALYEAVVAQELSAHGFDLFYANNKKRGEIDFLIEHFSTVIPLEIKSGKDYMRHSALSNLLNTNDFNIKKAYILNNDNLSVQDNKIYIPVYMIMFFHKKDEPKDEVFFPDISKLQNVKD